MKLVMIRCDRCGAELAERGGKKADELTLCVSALDAVKEIYYKPLDLCPACQRSIENWYGKIPAPTV